VLAATLLTYTQGLINFGLWLPAFLLLEIIFDRTPPARRRQLGLVLAGALGLLASVALFYARYVPVVIQIQRGEPMKGEQIKLDLDRMRGPQPAAEHEEDPDVGSTINPWRGVHKAARRLIIFYGVFALPVVAGFWLVLRRQAGSLARLVGTWGATYLLLNLVSAGLPSPNLFRYNKDLEIVAPLACLALAAAFEWTWRRARWLGLPLAASWLAFAGLRAWTALVTRFPPGP